MQQQQHRYSRTFFQGQKNQQAHKSDSLVLKHPQSSWPGLLSVKEIEIAAQIKVNDSAQT